MFSVNGGGFGLGSFVLKLPGIHRHFSLSPLSSTQSEGKIGLISMIHPLAVSMKEISLC